jgi:catechol 2,3-dioxygenase-like lactoylglutathione lyase family enzyme
MKQSLASIALVVHNYDEAIAFYTQKLHFTLNGRHCYITNQAMGFSSSSGINRMLFAIGQSSEC